MTKNAKLSIIIPSYNEQDNIPRTFHTIKEILDNACIPFELIFVDDGSTDLTYPRICQLSTEYPEIKGLSFSRNFGKEAAIFAGLEAASGASCIVMDCDLQHPAPLLPDMYRLWAEGYEIVEGIKSSRGRENPLHTMCANCFYRLISRAVGIDMSKASDFKLMDRKVVDALLLMPERAPFFRALSSWVGFKTTTIPFDVQERSIGSSKWSVWSLTKYAIQNITSFSGIPMQFVTLMGWGMLIASLALGIQSLYKYFSGMALEGFTTVILLQLIIGSVLMISLGIIGHYISKIYDEIKARPRYIISKRCGC
ncbi:MAG: glycosyltransferase family 2 protein [Clostridiales bacterium]|nr:glycosyltransferase family 2 protein [Clostridiales bacterium]